MPWNRSDVQSNKINQKPSWPCGTPRSRKSNNAIIRNLLLIITATTIIAACYTSFNADSEKGKFIKNQTISQGSSRKSRIPKGIPIHIVKRKPNATKNVKYPELTDGNPIVKKALGRVIQWKHRGEMPLFTNRFESLVCEIMTAIPGERFLDLDIEEEFEESFQKSLAHQITISPDDTEYVRYMKETVINAKKEVQKLIQEGNSAREIILNARDELNKIADYRDKLQESVNEFLVTATDVKETLKFVNEANQILAEYGAMPVDGPDDEDTAYELMIHAKEEKLKKLDEEEKQSQKE